MNETIRLLNSRVSCRNFNEGATVAEDEINTIIQAAKQAPNWSNGQSYSIVILRGDEKTQFVNALKQQANYNRFYEGQVDIIDKSSVYMLFCADLYRAATIVGDGFDIKNNIEPLLITTADTAIALQAAETATQALKLGCVIQGVIRFFGNFLCDYLKLPKFTFPLFGFAIGKPAIITPPKPRINRGVTIFEGCYDTAGPLDVSLREYDEALNKQLLVLFGDGRSWLETTRKFYLEKQYPEHETYTMLNRQGFID